MYFTRGTTTPILFVGKIVQFVEIGISYNFQLSGRIFHADAHFGCEIESLLWSRVMANACAFSATIYALPHCERRPGILSCRKNFAQRLQRASCNPCARSSR